MSWVVNDAEFEHVLALSAPRRYEYFIKRSAGGELWGVHGDGGWVMAEDDDGRTLFPVWPHTRFAEACSTEAWADGTPQADRHRRMVDAWIPQLSNQGFGIAVFQTPSDRGVAVPPDRIKRDLEDELSQTQQMRVRDVWMDYGVVLSDEIGQPLAPWSVSADFRRLVRELELPRTRFHDLRHAHATQLLASGVHPKAVSERLGHSSVAFTMDTYSAVIPSLGRAAADAADQLFG
jgi:Protein of unknown function (DUF2750)/Phage integrase family